MPAAALAKRVDAGRRDSGGGDSLESGRPKPVITAARWTRGPKLQMLRGSGTLVFCGLCVLVGVAASIYVNIHGKRAAHYDLLIASDAVQLALGLRRRSLPALSVAPGCASVAASLGGEGGEFRAEWNATSAALRVTWKGCEPDAAPTTLWTTRPSQPFVAAARGESVFSEKYGNFQIRDRIVSQCVVQRVESVEAEERGSLVLSGGFDDASADCRDARWHLRLGREAAPQQARFELRIVSSRGLQRAQLAFAAPASPASASEASSGSSSSGSAGSSPPPPRAEPVWGTGVQFTHFNMRGHCVPVWVSEQGLGRSKPSVPWWLRAILTQLASGATGDDYTTYAASASYISAAGVGLVLENDEFAHFDLGSGGCEARTILSGGLYGSVGAGVGTFAISTHASAVVGRLLAPSCAVPWSATAASHEHGQRSGFVAASVHLATLHTLTEYVGRMAPLPQWADTGALLGLQGGSRLVRAKVERIAAAGVPIAALWLQDWAGKRNITFGAKTANGTLFDGSTQGRVLWNWVLDEGLYEGWDELRDSIAPARLLTYVNPMLADVQIAHRDGELDGGGSERLSLSSRNLFDEAKAAGYLVHGRTPDVVHQIDVAGFDASLIDLTNPDARTWVAQHILQGEMIERVQSSGWMADFGEAMPCEDVSLHDGRDACTYHNRYALDWAKLNQQAVREAGKADEVLIFHRSGHTTSPSAARLMWLGDQIADWDEHDGLSSALTGLISGGMSGFALTHSDVGGYTGFWFRLLRRFVLYGKGRDAQLLMRWAEFSAFSGAVLRSHEGLTPDDFHQLWSDEPTLAHFASMANTFVAFRPYRRALMDEAAAHGWPLARHPVMHFPHDPTLLADVLDADGGDGVGEGGRGEPALRQFMLGADWMMLPVLEPDATSVRGYFPAGGWVPLWQAVADERRAADVLADGGARVHGAFESSGEWRTVPAPVGQPAVYARRGAPSLAQIVAAMRAELPT